MVSLTECLQNLNDKYINIILDGRVLGYLQHEKAEKFTTLLRKLKCKGITAKELGIHKKYMNIITEDIEIA